MENDILIIPDVHGREFWKEAKDYPGKIVFLGDYLDPYTYPEGITTEQALENFEEILEFAKSRDNVTLLVGNHDLGYFLSYLICNCRTDGKNYWKISEMFIDNADLFDLAYCAEHNGEKILLTHASVHREWLDLFEFKSEDPEEICEFLNNEFNKAKESSKNGKLNRRDKIVSLFAECSRARGGWSNVGSCVWADCHEWDEFAMFGDDNYFSFYQIFGHTQLDKEYPLIGKHCACIDTKECYKLSDIMLASTLKSVIR